MFALSAIFSKLLDWRFILLIVVVCAVGYGYYEWHSITKARDQAVADLAVEKKNVETLKANQATLEAANKQNEVIIQQLQLDKATALQAVSDLTAAINKSNATYAGLKKSINDISAKPTALTPYFTEAIRGIQLERSKALQTKPAGDGK